MNNLFTNINKNEKNENTALLLMLGVLSEKLTEIFLEIEKSNKLSKEIISIIKRSEEKPMKEIVILQPLTKEDYMD